MPDPAQGWLVAMLAVDRLANDPVGPVSQAGVVAQEVVERGEGIGHASPNIGPRLS